MLRPVLRRSCVCQNFYSKCLGSAEAKAHYVEKLEKRYGRAMGLTDDELFG